MIPEVLARLIAKLTVKNVTIPAYTFQRNGTSECFTFKYLRWFLAFIQFFRWREAGKLPLSSSSPLYCWKKLPRIGSTHPMVISGLGRLILVSLHITIFNICSSFFLIFQEDWSNCKNMITSLWEKLKATVIQYLKRRKASLDCSEWPSDHNIPIPDLIEKKKKNIQKRGNKLGKTWFCIVIIFCYQSLSSKCANQ